MTSFFQRLQGFWAKQKDQFIEKSAKHKGNDILNSDFPWRENAEYWRQEVIEHFHKWMRAKNTPDESKSLVALANLTAALDIKLDIEKNQGMVLEDARVIPAKGSHAEFFGNESYIVLGHLNTERSRQESMVIGQKFTYEGANGLIGELPYYRNATGRSIFSGGAVYSVPEKPLLPNSDYFRYMLLTEGD